MATFTRFFMVGKSRIEDVQPDRDQAARHVEKASVHLADARRDPISSDSRYLLGYQACLDAMAAVLTASGKRVTKGAGGHVWTIEATRTCLPGNDPLFDALDRLRRRRNQVSYDGEDASDLETDEIVRIATALIELAGSFIRR